ncbi:MAG: hypothetical protein ACYC2R_13535 [Burkholderiales bacterium]
MKKLILAVTLSIFFTPCFAQEDPIAQLQAALRNYPTSNKFAGYYLTCANIVIIGKSGIYAPTWSRSCLSNMMTKAVGEQAIQGLGWQFVYRTPQMDLVKAAQESTGTTYMLIHYDTAGNASELTFFNDTLP